MYFLVSRARWEHPCNYEDCIGQPAQHQGGGQLAWPQCRLNAVQQHLCFLQILLKSPSIDDLLSFWVFLPYVTSWVPVCLLKRKALQHMPSPFQAVSKLVLLLNFAV